LHNVDPNLEKLRRQMDQRDWERLAGFHGPIEIQAYLDTLTYGAENINRSPVRAMREGVAHCLDGALIAAVALRCLGYPPKVLNMFPEPETDDDHIIAIFQRNGYYGAVAKSNVVGLRYREPVFRTVRELVMSYFEFYFNVDGQKTLRSCTRPLNLKTLDHTGWMWSDRGTDEVYEYLGNMERTALITDEMAAALSATDPLTYSALMQGALEEGLYRPKKGER
jgi:hypothetical protein